MADEKYWTYRSSTPTPIFGELPVGVFNGDQKAWESLSPGMRREIFRSWKLRSSVTLDDKPLAAAGLTSYRCKNRFGWTMIGARDHADAFREALRSDETSQRVFLQVWNGKHYVPAIAPPPY